MGEYYRGGHHMSYSRLDCPMRTHEDFINKVDEDHHLYDAKRMEFIRSPLEDMIGIDMIKSFPVSDSMHLFELGKTLIVQIKRMVRD